MCCRCIRLHRHQIHLISYGCVSISLITTGLVFTIFAIFQKDSQIGKVWLAGPTTMVVGLVLCGKIIIDWGPAMLHGREGTMDSLDQLTLSNPLPSSGLFPNVGNMNQLKVPLSYENPVSGCSSPNPSSFNGGGVLTPPTPKIFQQAISIPRANSTTLNANTSSLANHFKCIRNSIGNPYTQQFEQYNNLGDDSNKINEYFHYEKIDIPPNMSFNEQMEQFQKINFRQNNLNALPFQQSKNEKFFPPKQTANCCTQTSSNLLKNSTPFLYNNSNQAICECAELLAANAVIHRNSHHHHDTYPTQNYGSFDGHFETTQANSFCYQGETFVLNERNFFI